MAVARSHFDCALTMWSTIQDIKIKLQDRQNKLIDLYYILYWQSGIFILELITCGQ